MRQAKSRSWKHLADERIEGVKPEIPLGKRFWPLSSEEADAVRDLFTDPKVQGLATMLRWRDDGVSVRVIDAAYWLKGCSSLGRLRMAVLVAIGKGKAEQHCLMDVKEAITASAPRSAEASMPRENAQRVVMGARSLSPFLGERMAATTLLGRSVVIRELLPQDLKFEIEHLTCDEAKDVAQFLSQVVGRAHARQMDASDREQWLKELQRNRSKSLDAPTWLWNSVVELVAAHEAAYLQHCRRYSMEEVT